MYNSYEEYMQSRLGYNVPNNTYNTNSNYYGVTRINPNMQRINEFYPEIYGIVYPVVQKVCSRKSMYNISEEILEQMVNEVYDVIEPREKIEDTREVLKNGDVRNPRAKETRKPRPNNYLLRDLIKILIIRELLSSGNNNFPPIQGGTPMQNGMPRPPIMRARKPKNILKLDNKLEALKSFQFIA